MTRFHHSMMPALLLRALAERGHPQAEVLQYAGVDPAALYPFRGRVPWPDVRNIVQAALSLSGDASIALRAAQLVTFKDYGVLGAYWTQLPTVRESQRVAWEILPAFSNVIQVTTGQEDGFDLITVEPLPPMEPELDYACQFHLACIPPGMRHILGATARLEELRLCGTEVGDTADLERVLGCRVVTGQPRNELVLPTALLDARMPLADASILELLRPQFRQYVETVRQGLESTAWLRIRLEQRLAAEEPAHLPAVAAELGIPPRTLRARLAAEGTSFRAVLDEARRDVTLRLLTAPGVKVAALAVQIGYSDPAAFSRAFRRWTGTTPGKWRAQNAGAGFPPYG